MNKEKLIEAGIEYDQGVHRFAGKEQIYEKYLKKAFDGPQMENLKEQVQAEDYENAFKTAHDLKGMTGNLSMNRMFEKVCTLVEELRNDRRKELVDQEYEDVVKEYEIVKAALLED